MGDERPWVGRCVVSSRRAREERVREVVRRVGRRWFMVFGQVIFDSMRWEMEIMRGEGTRQTITFVIF